METELLIGNGKAVCLASLQGKQSKFPPSTYPNWPLEIKGHKRLNETWTKRECQRLVWELEAVDPTIWGDWVDCPRIYSLSQGVVLSEDPAHNNGRK